MDLPPDLEKAKDEIKGYAGAYGLDSLDWFRNVTGGN